MSDFSTDFHLFLDIGNKLDIPSVLYRCHHELMTSLVHLHIFAIHSITQEHASFEVVLPCLLFVVPDVSHNLREVLC